VTRIRAPSAALRKGPPHAPLHLPGLQVDAPLQTGAALSRADVGAALRVLAVLPAKSRRDLIVLQITKAPDIALRFTGGMTVRWGDAERLLAKRLALGVVLGAYRDAGKEPSFIDVSVPDRVLARPILK
jgi:cell division septal protein FtsQ